jgi:hypothetical protein
MVLLILTLIPINCTTPPPRKNTNPKEIMMCDTTIGIIDSLEE